MCVEDIEIWRGYRNQTKFVSEAIAGDGDIPREMLRVALFVGQPTAGSVQVQTQVNGTWRTISTQTNNMLGQFYKIEDYGEIITNPLRANLVTAGAFVVVSQIFLPSRVDEFKGNSR